MLFNEPKLLKSRRVTAREERERVSVLFNEPKLLKYWEGGEVDPEKDCFSALQRAEIAEILLAEGRHNCAKSFSALQRAEIAEILPPARSISGCMPSFSALQRAEIAEMLLHPAQAMPSNCFSALQRAEIAEMLEALQRAVAPPTVSVLFNEPKLLKSDLLDGVYSIIGPFQCSSTSRNC